MVDTNKKVILRLYKLAKIKAGRLIIIDISSIPSKEFSFDDFFKTYKKLGIIPIYASRPNAYETDNRSKRGVFHFGSKKSPIRISGRRYWNSQIKPDIAGTKTF